MKTKKIGLIILIIAVAVPAIAAAIIFGFGKNKTINCNNPEFQKYISAYTSGLISKTSTVKIKLLSDIVEEIDKNKKLPEKLFEITPKIKGEFYWLDDYTIEFRPEEMFKSGTEYYVKFKLGKLVKMTKELESFNFKFSTVKQTFDISIEEQKTIDKKTLQINNDLKKILASGGPTLTICKAPNGRGGSWNQEGLILFYHVSRQ